MCSSTGGPGGPPVRLHRSRPRQHERSTHAWDWTEARLRCLPVARRYARDAAEADDILQEALIRAWRMSDRCRSPEAPWPWLRRITANEALRARARDRDEPPPPDELGREDPELQRVDDADEARCALDALGSGERDVVRAFYFEDRSVPELAERLGLSVTAAKVRLHRARARMLKALKEE